MKEIDKEKLLHEFTTLFGNLKRLNQFLNSDFLPQLTIEPAEYELLTQQRNGMTMYAKALYKRLKIHGVETGGKSV